MTNLTKNERNEVITPNAMPRKVSPIRLQILGELVENKPRRLANNVSEHSVNRLAKRWIR